MLISSLLLLGKAVDVDAEDVAGAVTGQNCAFLTFDMLARTLKGVTSPTTVTFFAAKSMLNDETPVHIRIRKNIKPKNYNNSQ